MAGTTNEDRSRLFRQNEGLACKIVEISRMNSQRPEELGGGELWP